jgi:hypothetical protein
LSLQGGGGKPLQDYVDSGKLTIKEETFGEDIMITTETGQQVNCNTPLTGNNKTYSVDAMACRRVKISEIVETYTEQPDLQDFEEEEEPIPEITIDTEEIVIPKPSKFETTTNVERTREVAKKVVKKLLNECNYFERLKEDSPLIYNGIKDKIKYFNPAFHSMTPEGLNTRLTFLQQCMRPGETIPTIGDDGQVKENVDVSNTTFGAPPICVLRIGDFYHTKIVINSISINYEPMTFDINPEGIGVQPMFANIQMSFNFIGGQGIQGPVARLQNALSFNYYGNTEMYDDRSDVTAIEDSENLNRIVWEAIENQTPFGLNDKPRDEITQEAGVTIGEILTTEITTSDNGQENLTGNIEYKEIFKQLLDQVTDYSNTINDSIEKITDNYSIAGMKMLGKDRKFQEGKILGYFDGSSSNTNLFGSPFNIQENTNTIIDGCLLDIENKTSPMYKNFDNQDFTFSDKRTYKKNLQQTIEKRRNTWSSVMNSTITDIQNTQKELVRKIDTLNLVESLTDGFRLKSGRNVIYSIQGENTLNTLTNDLEIVGEDLKKYYDTIETKVFQKNINMYDDNFDFTLPGNTTINTPENIRFFMIFGYEVLNDTQKIIDEILGDLGEKEEWRKYVTEIIEGSTITIGTDPLDEFNDPFINTTPTTVITGLKYQYDTIFKFSKNIISTFKNENEVKKVVSYNPFNPNKERKFDYIREVENPVEKDGFFNILYKNVNTEGTSFNGKREFK